MGTAGLSWLTPLPGYAQRVGRCKPRKLNPAVMAWITQLSRDHTAGEIAAILKLSKSTVSTYLAAGG